MRQLKNVTEQISIIEQQRVITDTVLERYLPNKITTALPVLFQREDSNEGVSERDLLYKVLFEMKHDIAELRHTVNELTNRQNTVNTSYIESTPVAIDPVTIEPDFTEIVPSEEIVHEQHHITENLSLEQNEIEMIKKALEKHKGKRKDAAKELGISERTLYRKINEFGIS